ncbi:MAG: hypothetical protein HQK65_13825, partial [Desulfamplus sp.]|nr:hypothetical protein [Desulfamplus sp.]
LLRGTPVIYSKVGGMAEYLQGIIPEYGYSLDDQLAELKNIFLNLINNKSFKLDTSLINYSFKDAIEKFLSK